MDEKRIEILDMVFRILTLGTLLFSAILIDLWPMKLLLYLCAAWLVVRFTWGLK